MGHYLVLESYLSDRNAAALHVLDPIFREVTLENVKLKAIARDLKFHHDPVGESTFLLDPRATVA